MKKPITLPQLIKTFPKDKCFYKEQHHKINNLCYSKDLDYYQKLNFVGNVYKTTERLSVTENCIYYVLSQTYLKRYGKTFYPEEADKTSIYINKNTINFKNITLKFLCSFLSVLEIDWFRDIDEVTLYSLLKNKIIFRKIITNRIYNEETLYKAAGTYLFKTKNVSWKTVRKYFQFNSCYPKINATFPDLYYFTKNIDQTIDILFNAENVQLYDDLIQSAIKLNEVVNLMWSPKRIVEEHKRQTEILIARELSEKESVPIYDVSSINFPFELLNTEKDIFYEGSTMHHCLYNCYYHRIKNHSYIAFHLDYPEECTLGIYMCNGEPKLNQVYKKYDVPVSEETRQYVINFVKDYKEDLIKLFDQKNDTDSGDYLPY